MSVMLWDSASQAFVEAQNTPMVYDKENQAWRETTGYVWDETNQAYKEVWNSFKVLYDNGSYDKNIVGGFTFRMCHRNSSTQGSLNTDHIYMPEYYGYWESVYTTNKIDLKGFSKLYFDQSTRSDEGTHSSFGVTDSIHSNGGQVDFVKAKDVSSHGRGIYSLDISGINEPKYICYKAYGTYTYIYKIWLE